VFDAGGGGWELLPQQLASERKYCAAAALGGRLLVLGGMNEARSRLASVEGYDPREGRWRQLTSMTVSVRSAVFVASGFATPMSIRTKVFLKSSCQKKRISEKFMFDVLRHA
jgi:hypothetical protein